LDRQIKNEGRIFHTMELSKFGLCIQNRWIADRRF
jgi:hypothetical protein